MYLLRTNENNIRDVSNKGILCIKNLVESIRNTNIIFPGGTGIPDDYIIYLYTITFKIYKIHLIDLVILLIDGTTCPVYRINFHVGDLNLNGRYT